MIVLWRVRGIVVSIFLILAAHPTNARDLPAGFVYLHDVDATIVEDIRYATDNNFVGKPLSGYGSADCILIKPAAKALALLQSELVQSGLTLVVFDCYRPARAVRDMMDYVATKKFSDQTYFPNLLSHQLIQKGYIASRSGHSAGGTVDLTIASTTAGKVRLLDMGTRFDFFDPKSHTETKLVSGRASENRQYLKSAMDRAGFTNYPKEWWHFRYRDEPFRGRIFDFNIERRH